jgi:hypothetical protein
MELEKNKMLTMFSNSFLVVAGGARQARISFEGLGIMFSDRPWRDSQTIARIVDHEDGSIWVRKCLQAADEGERSGPAKIIGYEERWVDSVSIQTQLLRKAKRRSIRLGELVEPCQIWIRKLRSLAVDENGDLMLDGKYLDCIWSNCFIDNGECVFVDKEWVWERSIALNVLVIRSAYYFLYAVRTTKEVNTDVRNNKTKASIKKIARELGVELRRRDFQEFVRLEIAVSRNLSGGLGGGRLGLTAMLFDRRLFVLRERSLRVYKRMMERASFGMFRLRRLLGMRMSSRLKHRR